jgi:hypothetical protein
LFYSLSFFIILKAQAINCEIWQSSVLTVSPPRTNAVGAQPRATVCNTHTIAVIDEGKVVEQGYRSILHQNAATVATHLHATWLQRLILKNYLLKPSAATHPPFPYFCFILYFYFLIFFSLSYVLIPQF